jgi:hypothetical protein
MDLAQLLTVPGPMEECILRCNVGFMALHGGLLGRCGVTSRTGNKGHRVSAHDLGF